MSVFGKPGGASAVHVRRLRVAAIKRMKADELARH
jgi:hypothetical protein